MAEQAGFRSGFEYDVAKQLQRDGVNFEYETMKLKWVKPATEHTYTPDIILPSGIIVEIKGRFELSERKKMLAIIEQHPDKDIRMVLQNSKTKLRKGGVMNYGQWLDKKGIKWAEKQIPKDWY